MSETVNLHRRDFARHLTAGVAGGTLGMMAGNTVAQDTEQSEPPKPPSLAALRLAAVMTECPGEHWTQETIAEVLGDIRADIARGKALSEFPLQNGDDPATIFMAPAPPYEAGDAE
ncbi:hypothetical protein GC163_06035 [bacterium]|nr:hypothetical protein [bacterium]